jgi:predicted transposase/invertase (TIGR01784 family)
MTGSRRTLDPKLDIVFWMLFGEERNRGLLLSLLNAVLQPVVPIVAVEVLHSEPEKLTVVDKAIALDVRARLINGEQVDIEMQSQRRPALPERLLYYWARLYAGQLFRGSDYRELRRCALVLFTNFSMLTAGRFHSIFQVREARDGQLLTEQLELHVLELPKLPSVPSGDEPTLTLWGRFLSATTDAELETLSMEHPVLNEAKEALESLSADPEARLRAEQRETALLLYKLDIGTSREEGRAEGRTEGRAEGKAEALRKLMTLKFGALPGAVLQQISTASEPKLEAWLERVLSASSWDEVFQHA